ncbi:UNVERIFIED_CONTAM: hypothetical protein Scaly_0058900 [Sesamum calycinum]|uniref:Retrotransposon Copia-like N-terminal domain-containing protein n=1 Tax=Sesamum calycinum TaxID=2727403 RepID=A0AAW2SVG4_9LAMI
MIDEKVATSSAKKTLEISSLYLLHLSDSPGAIITTCMLNGDNYDMWEKAMANALRSKNKLEFIDGSLRKLDSDNPEDQHTNKQNSREVPRVLENTYEDLAESINGIIETGNEGEVSKLKERPDASNEAVAQVENGITRPR